jgi:hypothetical protein
MTEKVIGYIFLTVGIIIIAVVAFNAIGVFTGSNKPNSIIRNEGNITMDFSVPGTGGLPTASVPVEIKNYSQIIDIANLVLFVVFSGFFASIGYKIAMVGANLVRPVVVKTRSDALKSPPQNTPPQNK